MSEIIKDWKELEEKAKRNINYNGDRLLIEIAAQHPLNQDGSPGIEFESRLLKALQYDSLNTYFYVPGSHHNNDLISLKQSGELFLLTKGVKQSKLINWNGEVYNSIDECEMGAKIFFEQKFDKLISICSPAQLHRKALAYIKFGLFPIMVSVPVKNMYHSYVDEALIYIPDFLGNGLENKRNRESRKQNGTRT